LLLAGRADFHQPYGTFITPRASFGARFTPELTYRIGVGTGFKAPTIFVEEFEERGFLGGFNIHSLKPERAINASTDVNWRTAIGDMSAQFNAVLYYTRLKDPILAVDSQWNVLFEEPPLTLYNAPGPLESRGVEFSTVLVYDDFHFIGTYAYTYATVDDIGGKREIELNPRHVALIDFIYEDEDNGWFFGNDNFIFGSQELRFNPYLDRSPVYFTSSLLVIKELGPLKIFFNADNIFDVRMSRVHPVLLGNPHIAEARPIRPYMSIEGRVFSAGIRYSFGEE
jgi:outer membrane receptor for ferrienterochelin and colicins